MSSYFSRDDIAQIGTPPGHGPTGALRLSGDNAFAILARVSRIDGMPDFPAGPVKRGVRPGAFTLPLSVVRTGADGAGVRGRELFPCPARFFLMPAPASYTRENVAEVHLPGSPAILGAALAALVEAGARPALPGEFTFRAFRNGRMSLAQAEAVEELIRSGSDGERRRALSRLGDRDAARVAAWLDRTLDAAAKIEAALDFPEEAPDAGAAAGLAALLGDLEREGFAGAAVPAPAESGPPRVALVGLANAGKSSLFNALLNTDAALVSSRASTTRDSIVREVEWRGERLALSDNPGFHPEGGGGGRAAADRAFSRLGGDDLACWVVDGSRAPGEREAAFAARLRGGVLLAVNKCDLPPAADASAWREILGPDTAAKGVFTVSAATGQGLDELKNAIASAVRTLAGGEAPNRRETLELAAAARRVRAAAAEISAAGRLELAAENIRLAAAAFSRALGDGYAEETLERIFSRFCIGK